MFPTRSSAIASDRRVPDPTTLAEARAIVAKYASMSATPSAARSTMPPTKAASPGDGAFARCAVRIDRASEGLAPDRRGQGSGERRYAIIDSAPTSEGEARDVRGQSRAPCAEGPRRRQAGGDPLGRRTHRDRARQRARQAPTQEYALALDGLAPGHARDFGMAGEHDGADGGAGSASRSRRAMIDQTPLQKNEIARARSKSLSRQNDATASSLRPAISSRPARRSPMSTT